MRILVVDDVGYVRHYFDRLLTKHGHLVWTAACGSQALEILKKEAAIQVVITDLLMPGMDGLEFYRTAQKIELRSEAGVLLPKPVFFLITALRPSSVKPHNEINLLQQALQLGFAEVLLKPIDNEHLLRQLALLETNLLSSSTAAGAATAENHAELLHAIDQSIERLLSNPAGESLTELAELLNSSLARIPAIIGQLDTQRGAQSSTGEFTLAADNSQLEPALAAASGLSAGELATVGQSNGSDLVAENGLSTEKQL